MLGVVFKAGLLGDAFTKLDAAVVSPSMLAVQPIVRWGSARAPWVRVVRRCTCVPAALAPCAAAPPACKCTPPMLMQLAC